MTDLGGKAKDLLGSDKGEKASDAAIDQASKRADSATGGGHGEQIDKASDAADTKIGE